MDRQSPETNGKIKQTKTQKNSHTHTHKKKRQEKKGRMKRKGSDFCLMDKCIYIYLGAPTVQGVKCFRSGLLKDK